MHVLASKVQKLEDIKQIVIRTGDSDVTEEGIKALEDTLKKLDFECGERHDLKRKIIHMKKE